MSTSLVTDPIPDGDRTTFGAVSRLNHWAVALVMLAALAAGLGVEYVPLADEARGWLMGWHKAIGVIVLALGLWRLGWRLRRGFPAPAAPSSRRQETTARVLHWTLLATTVVMPLSGIAMTIFDGRAIDLVGSLAIPPATEIPWLAESAEAVHVLGGTLLVGLIGLHVAAALKHHFIDRDATLVRMVSGRHPAARRPPIAAPR
jgi:cytochrome b561